MTVSTLVQRAAVVALAGIGVVGQLAYLTATATRSAGLRGGADVEGGVGLLVVLGAHASVSATAALVATVLAFRGGASRSAPSLAIALASWSYVLAYPGIVLLARPDPGALRTAFDGHFIFAEFIGLGALLRFTSRFPAPLAPGALRPRAPTSRYARALRGVRRALLRPGPVWGAVFAVPAVHVAVRLWLGSPVGDAALDPSIDAVRVAAASFIVLNLLDSWVTATAAQRSRIYWLFAGVGSLLSSVVLVIGGNVLLAATGWEDTGLPWRPVVLDLGVLAFVLCLGATQVAPSRIDPSRVARALAQASGVAISALALSTGLESLLASGVLAPVRLPTGFGAALAVTIVGLVSSQLVRFFGGWIPPSSGSVTVTDGPAVDTPDPT